MKRKVKKYDVGGMTDEEGKKGIFGGPKYSMQDEDTRFKGQAYNRETPRSGLPSFKESTGTSYGSGSSSDSAPAKKTPPTKRKLPSNPSAKEFTGEVVKAKDLGSQSFAAPAAKKESSSMVPASLAAAAAALGGLGLANMKGNMRRSGTGSHESAPRKGIMALDPSQADYLDQARFADEGNPNFKRGGKVKKMSSGGSTASRRGDGCAVRGKTKGKIY
jgi:hypothetical protein